MKKRTTRVLAALIILGSFLNSEAQDGHNARNSLDWQGIYRGVLPCADCEGIQTTIYLNTNLSFQVSTLYLGKSTTARVEKGKFSWNREGNTISLRDSLDKPVGNYFVKENSLTLLDANNEWIKGPLASRFVLTKGSYAILEKYWKLVGLYGKPVKTDSTMRREAHLIFKDSRNRFAGNGGCNNISGQYTVTSPDSIRFSKAISTMMACPDLATESLFLKALGATRTYSVSADRLVLLDSARTRIAEFRTVYMH